MKADGIARVCKEVADKCGANYRYFGPGERIPTLIREISLRFANIGTKSHITKVVDRCTEDKSNGIDMELIMRGSDPNGRLY